MNERERVEMKERGIRERQAMCVREIKIEK